MLTADLVPARRRGNNLFIPKLDAARTAEALAIAQHYITVTKTHLGNSRHALDELCAAFHVRPQDRKLADGLHKLILDRCEFDVEAELDPAELRREVFTVAAEQRRRSDRENPFDPGAVRVEVAAKLQLDPSRIEQLLYADLKDAHTLRSFDSLTPEELVARYEQALRQGVLLKALSVDTLVSASSPATYRRLFNKLKFLQLLYTVQPVDDGYRIHIDGPASLFSASTKYGVKLAMLLPTLEKCGRFKLRAQVAWGKERQKLEFKLEGRHKGTEETARANGDHDNPELTAFTEKFNGLSTEWRAEPCSTILNLPGVGLCIPDLAFRHAARGIEVFFEVLGFWSRAAVWRRVELVEAGLPYRIIFAVSKRLRVSAEVLDDDQPGSLYVYKGKLNAKAVAQLLERHLDPPEEPCSDC